MQWLNINSEEDYSKAISQSFDKPILIFKHSTRCSVSSMAKRSLEYQWGELSEKITPLYLDLITYRAISNKIALDFNIEHQSPQVLLISSGKCLYNASHNDIDATSIAQNL
jgi:bacillithiol system protein YtxJ